MKPNELLDNETEMENNNDLNHGGDISGTNEFSEFDFDEDFFEETQDRRRKSKRHKLTDRKGMDDDIHNLFESNTTEERQWHERSTLSSLVQNDAEECKNEDIFNIPTSTIGEASCVNEIPFGQHMDEEQKNKLQNLVNEFSDVFSNQPGKTIVIEHRIILTTDKPIRQCPYHIPQAYREKVKKEIEEMEENGIIRKSKSEWASPLVIVPKKDGSLRVCIDFRRLNVVSEFDAYPMPLVKEVLDRMGYAKYLSTLDMTKRYWQIPLAGESKDKTAFIAPFGLHEFNVMPFGLHGAPAINFSETNGQSTNGPAGGSWCPHWWCYSCECFLWRTPEGSSQAVFFLEASL